MTVDDRQVRGYVRAMPESDRLSERFRELLEYLGSQMGSARGWKQDVAGRVGIHPTHMSKVLAGTRSIQWSTAVEAAERLGLDLAYFNGSGPPSDYFRATSKKATVLSDVQRQLGRMMQKARGALTIDPSPDDAAALADLVLRLEIVRAADAYQKDPTRRAAVGLFNAVYMDFSELVEPWREPSPAEVEALNLTPDELHVCRIMRTSPAQFAKMRDTVD